MHNVFKQIHDWDFIYSQQNPDTAIEILINEIKRIIQLSTTRKKAHKKHNLRSKWIFPGIIKSCLEKEKMYKMWRQDPGNMTLKQRYRSYAKVLEKIILKAKRNYDITEAEKASTNNKKLWNYIKEKIGKKHNKIKNDFDYLEENGLKIQGDTNVSKHLNEFFSTIGSNLSRKIIKTHLTTPQSLYVQLI